MASPLAPIGEARLYQLIVSLNDIKPVIWRRVHVPASYTFAQFHRVLVATMGWEGYHDFRFSLGGVQIALPQPDFDHRPVNARSVNLNALEAMAQFTYTYDLGDDWEHTVRVEKAGYGVGIARCLDGERACPPEDCDGAPGYRRLLQALNDPRDGEHQSYLRWVGSDWDSERFDVAEANAALAKSRLPRAAR